MNKAFISSTLKLAAIMCCLGFASIAQSAVISVDCGTGEKVRDAIKQAKFGQPTTIFVNGHCNETLIIKKDQIILSGNEDGDGSIDGSVREIQVLGARRVEIEFMEVTGIGYGILADEGAFLEVRNSYLHDNVSDGIGVGNQSFARVSYSVIERNGRPAPFYEAGIEVWAGSVLRSVGNRIADNPYAAVEVGSQSYFRSGYWSPNGDPDPADLDVLLQKGCSQGAPAGTCGTPGSVAIDFYRGGIADLRNTDITGKSVISGLSNLDVRTSTINGNVEADGGSRIHLRNTVTGSGFVSCYSESFASAYVGCSDNIPSP
jgi:hypothetical protein